MRNTTNNLLSSPEGRGMAKKIGDEAKANLIARLSPRQARQYGYVPPRYQRSWLNAVLGESSSKKCIRAKCQECVGWEDVNVRVSTCDIDTCALWAQRPYQSQSVPGEDGSTPAS